MHCSVMVSCHGYIAMPLSSARFSCACSAICELFLRWKNPHWRKGKRVVGGEKVEGSRRRGMRGGEGCRVK